jgi:GDP-4-dehydro-6-deoxy-D-mannose reductase
MKRLLVTGQHGFVGSTLVDMLHHDPQLRDWSLLATPHSLDLRDAQAVGAIVTPSTVPDAVIHLAAQSWVPDSFRDPATTLAVNVVGTLNLLQALQRCRFAGRMIYVGTGDVYGIVPEAALPVTEQHLPVPRNPYAVSKLAAEALCRQWSITESIDVVLARPFNHIGCGQSERFVVSDFARQVSAIRHRRRLPVVAVGDIDVTRDFTDVRDVVRAYFALLERGTRSEVYNVCSGHDRSVRSILERLAQLAGVDVTVRVDPARMRKAEQRRIRGDASKIREATGWQAATPLDDSLAAMLEFWDHEDHR